MKPVLELRGIAMALRGNSVLEHVELDVLPGQHWLLTGPSGSGKSTLLRIIAGLDAPDCGSVTIQQKLVSRAGSIPVPPHLRHVSLMFQDLGLWPSLSVEGNVHFALPRSTLKRSQRKARTGEALQTCRIAHLARRRPASLSGGEQQRVALARALAPRPQLLLLDEPFGNLDIALRQSLLGEIANLASRFGINVLLVSHHLPDARMLNARIAVLENRTIIEAGDWDDLMTAPRSKTLRAWRKELEQIMVPRAAAVRPMNDPATKMNSEGAAKRL